jgi:XTP/dITP diphosphohydrolase
MDILVIGTGNQGKFREISRILGGVPFDIRPLSDFPDAPPVVEDRDTFEGNAEKKAVELADRLGLWVAADDSGIEVDALDGAPGVRSARYAGPEADPLANNARLLSALSHLPDPSDRTARFVCAVVLARPGEVLFRACGETPGRILEAAEGERGFGYDPVFFSFELGMSFGLAPLDEKNAVSHRGRAFGKLREFLKIPPGRTDT